MRLPAKEDRLSYFQALYERAKGQYAGVLDKMDGREALYRGRKEMKPIVDGHRVDDFSQNVRNIIAENIESEIDSNIPQPKVTPRRQEDEERAKLIEDLIRNELDRLPMEEYNDLMERMVPIQGGGFWLIEWDDTLGSYYRTGENAVTVLHPKTVIPQDGVVSSIEDMDYIIIAQPETKGYVKRRWNKAVNDEGEEAPEIRGVGEETTAEDLVSVFSAYYKQDDGKIGRFIWCNNLVLEDMEDYQARKHRRCKDCGRLLPYDEDKIREMIPKDDTPDEAIARDMYDLGVAVGKINPEEPLPVDTHQEKPGKLECPYCGGKLETVTGGDEPVFHGFTTRYGITIPDARPGIGEDGAPAMIPTMIPSYTPDVFPIILQRNVSMFGSLLGDSDVDKIEDQQNAVNWYQRKIDDRLLGAGSVIALPKDSSIDIDPDDNRIWRVGKLQDLQLIKVIDFSSDLNAHFGMMSTAYESARQILGITDSFQGRRDTTATSGRAKEFAAQQTAGRLESKRMLKQAAWARLFELIFKFTLAYAEEPRQIFSTDEKGDAVYKTFDRWDFLEYDKKTGNYFWNDDFVFSCDSSAPLAANRAAMWQECRELFAAGAYGNPQDPATLILFWSEMERLHYPLAAAAKRNLTAQREQMMQPQPVGMPQMPGGMPGSMPRAASIMAPDGKVIP